MRQGVTCQMTYLSFTRFELKPYAELVWGCIKDNSLVIRRDAMGFEQRV